MSGGQCMETESGSSDGDIESSSLTHSLSQTADTAPATSVTSPYHRHRQPSGGMSTFCHILRHMFYLNLNLTSQHK